MGTFLQIVGAVVLTIIALLLIGGAALLLFFRYKVAQITKMAKMIGGPVAPLRITLDRDDNAQLPDAAKGRQLRQEFESLGFAYAGTYSIPGMQGTIIMGFANEQLPAYGIITYHPLAPKVFSEVVQQSVGGDRVTITQSTVLTEKRPINQVAVSMPDATVRDLVAELGSRSLEGELRPHRLDTFKEDFEQAYYEGMKFNYEQGDLREVDGTEIAALIQQQIDPETKQFLSQLHPPEEEIEDRLLAAYLEQSGISGLEWEKQRDSTVFVYDGLDTEDVGWLFDEYINEEDADVLELVENMKGENARETFARAAQHLSLSRRPTFLLQLGSPVPCDVYRFDP